MEAQNANPIIYDIVSTLIKFSPTFPSLRHILRNMESRDRSTGRIVSYNMNTTVLFSIIRQSYTDFLEPIREHDEPDEDSTS
jgi:hypothetical protein